jgi:hypothetical protein
LANVNDIDQANQYLVRVERAADGWEVRILETDGSVAWTRHCAGEAEARTFASTVRQHVYWLSPEKFREYYRLDADGVSGETAE